MARENTMSRDGMFFLILSKPWLALGIDKDTYFFRYFGMSWKAIQQSQSNVKTKPTYTKTTQTTKTARSANQ
jgi:hypothetical protein